MLCCLQVATKTQITAEQYLRMTFEHDAEFVHGEIVERSMPTYSHSLMQSLLLLRFGALIAKFGVCPLAELRVKIAQDLYRIPDVVLYQRKLTQEVPDYPPLVAIEIPSKDDRHSDLMQKLEEYRVFGVTNIWVIDPTTKKFSSYTERGLQNASSLSLPEYSFELTPADLFSEL